MQRLSGLQLAVMQVLWRNGPSSVADVQKALGDERPLAYSTLATILKRLEDKQVVRHTVDGRTYIYEPAAVQQEVEQSLLSDLVDNVFSGRLSELVSHLLESQDVDAGELARIRSLVEKHQKAARQKSPRRSP
jgi:predicted transcriptional regulator